MLPPFRNCLFPVLLILLPASARPQAVAPWPFTAALDSIVMDPKYKPENPGFAVLIIENGQIVYERQRGMANREKGLPIGPDTRFNIGSITKQFTAAAIFLLEDRGLLRLDDPVQRYLPELPDFGAPVTLRHLLSHTSGIPDHFEVASMQDKFKNSYCDPGKAIELLRAAPELGFAPGSDFAYCNTGYMLLAAVVERVSGQSMHDFAVQNIFAPLGMSHSNFFQLEKDGLPDGTASYEASAKKKGRFKRDKPIPNATGATGVQTTLRDFFLWDQNFYHNRLGGGALIQKMETTDTLRDGSPIHYGGGLLLKSHDGRRMVSHGGGWNGFLMEYRRFPDLNTSVLVASNNDFSNPFRLADTICRRILPAAPVAAPPPATAALPPLPLENFEGTFLSANNFIRRVRAVDAQLFIAIPRGAGGETLIPLDFVEKSPADNALVFRDATGLPVVFALDSTGQRPLGFHWEGGHYFQLRRFYKKLDAPATGPATRAFGGKYRSEMRRQNLRIRRDGRTGNLVVKPVFFLKYPLEPLGGGAFRVRGETIVLRFEAGRLVLGNDWTYGLTLKKVR